MEKLGITVWSSAVFWRTGSGPGHANPLEGGISNQDFFQSQFVLPAVSKIVLVQQSRAWSSYQIPQFRAVRLLLLLKNELVKVGIRPPHYDLQCAVQLV
jgi:hypothetical protein